MAQNQAVKTISPGNAQIVDAPIPKLPADDYILVRTTAVAINPTDWKHVELADKLGCVGIWVGCDYAGVVEEVGPAVTKPFKKGDRISGPVNGSNGLREVDGSFAKYIVVKGDLQIKTPDNISDEQASTFGISITTVGQGLYLTLGLPKPDAPAKEPFTLFIYGGSTAMGLSGIQYAKLSGARVITTSSPRNFDYLKSLGADAVYDYNSPTVTQDIVADYLSNLQPGDKADDGLTLAWDCQSDAASASLIAKCMSRTKPAHVGTLLPNAGPAFTDANPNPDLKVTMSLYYKAFGEPFTYVAEQPAAPEEYEFSKGFWELSRKLYSDGKLKPIRTDVNRGGAGLEGVLNGLKELKDGKVSAAKLVYTL